VNEQKKTVAAASVALVLSALIGVAIGFGIRGGSQANDELGCGSIGRLVATAEHYVSESGNGSVYLRLGDNPHVGHGTTLSLWVYTRAKTDDGIRYERIGTAGAYAFYGEETVCQALHDVVQRVGNQYGWDVEGIDEARAREIQTVYEARPEDGRNFRVFQGWRDGSSRDRGAQPEWLS